jgi:hypothetical protein
MRNRTTIFAAMLWLPAALLAQRIPVPRIPTSIPLEPRTDPGEPRPVPVAQRLAYTRSAWSFETTNIASLVQAPGFGSDAGPLGRSWSLTGTDLHMEYRTGNSWGPTFDLSGAAFGNSVSSPLYPQPLMSSLLTVEPGVRWHMAPLNDRMTPFVDLRGNYMFADGSYQTLALSGGAGSAQQWVDGAKSSGGFGAVAGAGVETTLTGPWSLLTELSGIADRMRVTSTTAATPGSRYWMRWYRLSVGVNYNRIIYHHLAERAIP